MTREWYITHFWLQISCILESMADSWLVISGIDKAQFSYLACLSRLESKAAVPAYMGVDFIFKICRESFCQCGGDLHFLVEGSSYIIGT